MANARMLGAIGSGAAVIALSLAALPPVAAQDPSARPREEQHAIAELIARCTEDHRQYFASGLTRDQYLVFCNCYVHSALDAVDGTETSYRREHDGAPSPHFIETSRALVEACRQETRVRVPQ